MVLRARVLTFFQPGALGRGWANGEKTKAPGRKAQPGAPGAVQVGYSKPAYAKSAYAAPKIVSGFIVCATRPWWMLHGESMREVDL